MILHLCDQISLMFKLEKFNKMEKLKIQRKELVHNAEATDTKQRTNNTNHAHKQDVSDSESLQQKQAASSKHPPKPVRRKNLFVNFKTAELKLKNIDIIQQQNDYSVSNLKSGSMSNKQNFIDKSRSANEEYNLKNIFNNFRMSNMLHRLFNQLRKNSVYRSPVVFEPFSFQNKKQDSIKGIEIERVMLNMAFFISISQVFFACFLFTLLLCFGTRISHEGFIKYFQIFSIFCMVVEISIGMVRVKQLGQRKLTEIRQISQYYLRSTFSMDLLCLVSMIICSCIEDRQANYLLAAFILKIPQSVQKLNKIETRLFESFYWEQYWGLMKILLTNFLYAHFIAVLLLMMSWLDEEQSWLKAKNIINVPWHQQYSWAYYWSTTIMLTVGFGDISAGNYKQAICLVMIETISCMALAYNINCIGSLLRGLKANELEKSKQLKVLKKLCQKIEVNPDLNFRLSSHVKENYNIEQKYNFEQEKQFISKLPVKLRHDVLRSANFKKLVNLTFIKNFTHKTIISIAQRIEVKISHPEEIILGANSATKLIILREGEVGLFPNRANQRNNKILIDRLSVKDTQKSLLVSLDFLQLLDREYDIKSTIYSQIYQIETEHLLSILKRKDVDIELFYTMRDKQKLHPQNYQVIKCIYCGINHSKFKCPKLHYIPIIGQLEFKHLHKIKISKNERIAFLRQKINVKPLKIFKETSRLNKKQEFTDLENNNQQFLFLHQNRHNPLEGFDPFYSKQKISINEHFNRIPSQVTSHRRSFLPKNSLQWSFKSKGAISYDMRGYYYEKQDFWGLEIDEAKDYKFYFSKYNPKMLQNYQLKKYSPNKLKSSSTSKMKMSISSNFRKNT